MGDIIKINIDGSITSCVVLSDPLLDYFLVKGEKFLLPCNRTIGDIFRSKNNIPYDIFTSKTSFYPGHLFYEVLIGDQKVYIEEYEIYKEDYDL